MEEKEILLTQTGYDNLEKELENLRQQKELKLQSVLKLP